MDGRCYPCGARLDRSSATRTLKSPCLRMFMAIRSMKSLANDSKVCNVCRHLYNKWKNENSEFSSILTRLEHDMMVENDDEDDSVFFFRFSSSFSIFCLKNDTMDVCIYNDNSSSQLSMESPVIIKTPNNETVTLQLNSTSSSDK